MPLSIIIRHRPQNRKPWIVTLDTICTERCALPSEALRHVEQWIGVGHKPNTTMLQHLRQQVELERAGTLPAPPTISPADRPLSEAQRRYLTQMSRTGAWIMADVRDGRCQWADAQWDEAVAGRELPRRRHATAMSTVVMKLIEGGWLVEEPYVRNPDKIELPPFGTKYILSEKARLLVAEATPPCTSSTEAATTGPA